jgi:hypothetical protein
MAKSRKPRQPAISSAEMIKRLKAMPPITIEELLEELRIQFAAGAPIPPGAWGVRPKAV